MGFTAFSQVLLYDEPTAGLDPIASTVVEDLIRSVHMTDEDAVGKPGKIASYLVVTHQHSTIQRAVDRFRFQSILQDTFLQLLLHPLSNICFFYSGYCFCMKERSFGKE